MLETQKLSPKNQWILRACLTLLFCGFVGIITYIAHEIIFPKDVFTFNMETPNAQENRITGVEQTDKNISWRTSTAGSFSQGEFRISGGPNLQESPVSIRKTHQAFLYPETEPVGFKNGSLVSFERSFFMIQNQNLAQFPSQELIEAVGYKEDSFLPLSEKEFAFYTKNQTQISQISPYTDGTLFTDGETYYKLEKNTLTSFTSEQAFLSHYPKSYLIPLPESFESIFTVEKEKNTFIRTRISHLSRSISSNRGKQNPPPSKQHKNIYIPWVRLERCAKSIK